MTEPLDPLPSDISVLIAEERSAPGLGVQTRERLWEKLALLGPPPIPPSGGGGGGGDGGAGAAGSALATKIGIAVLAFAVGGVTGAAVHANLGAAPTPPTPPSIVASATASPSSSIASREDDGISPHALPDSTSSSAPKPASPPPAEDRLKQERASLEVARTAMTRGDFAAVLGAVDRHAREFPRGQLAEERDVLRIQALVGLGRQSEAKDRAARFQHDFPHSLMQGAVEAALQTKPAKKD